MRTTVDIPDETYKTIKILAAERGETFRDLILEGLEIVKHGAQAPPSKRFRPPLIPSTRTDKLVIDNEAIYDLIDFP